MTQTEVVWRRPAGTEELRPDYPLGRLHVMVEYVCPKHPDRVLLRAGRDTWEGAPVDVWIKGDHEHVAPYVSNESDDKGFLVVACSESCRTTSRLNWRTVQRDVNALYRQAIDSDGYRAAWRGVRVID